MNANTMMDGLFLIGTPLGVTTDTWKSDRGSGLTCKIGVNVTAHGQFGELVSKTVAIRFSERDLESVTASIEALKGKPSIIPVVAETRNERVEATGKYMPVPALSLLDGSLPTLLRNEPAKPQSVQPAISKAV